MHITVYAASSGQVPERYWQAAHQLGHCLAAHGHTLVNGAGRTGLMGATIDGILAAGGRAVGVIPQFMVEEHWEHTGMSELIVTPAGTGYAGIGHLGHALFATVPAGWALSKNSSR